MRRRQARGWEDGGGGSSGVASNKSTHREEGLLEDQQRSREADHQQWLGPQQAEDDPLQRRGHDQL